MSDDDLRQELESHIAMRAETYEREGMSPEEARAAARRQFGNLTAVAEETRAVHVNVYLESLMRDVSYTLRCFCKYPAFSLVAIVSLALGIGANTAIFTLADQVLFRLLPVRNPAELVRIEAPGPPFYLQADIPDTISYPLYQQLRDNNQVFDGIIAQHGAVVNAIIHGATQRIRCDLVSGNYYGVLGVQAAAGRLITPGDDAQPGALPVAVLGYDFWTNRFGADPSVIGRTLTIQQTPLTVIGVSERGFHGVVTDAVPDVTVPVTMAQHMTRWYSVNDHRMGWLRAFGRLKPGIAIRQAESSLNTLYAGLRPAEAQYMTAAMARYLPARLELKPALHGHSRLRSEFESPLRILLALVGLVLLMTCANVAGLLTARASARRGEFAVRVSLGASRARLIRQLMVESLLLAFAGGVFGLPLAWATARALITMLPNAELSAILSAAPDSRTIAFTLFSCAVAAALFGLAPAIRATRPGAQGGAPFRKALVALQVAIALPLMIAAGLFARTLYNLRTVDTGIAREHLMLFSLDPTLNGYTADRALRLFDRIEERLKAIPGVKDVATIGSAAPLNSGAIRAFVNFEGQRERNPLGVRVNEVYADPGAFAALGIPILAGREFLPSDTPKTRTVAVVTRSLAREHLGGSPIGKHVGFGYSSIAPRIEVVGMVGDILPENPRGGVYGTLFLPLHQAIAPISATFHVRTAIRPKSLFDTVVREVRNIAPAVPVFHMKTMTTYQDEALSTERMLALLSISFGAVAVLLAAVGLYGVIAFSVSRRKHEFAVRMALGADRGDIFGQVSRDIAVMLGAGLILGAAAAVVMCNLIRALLYGVQPFDGPTIAAASLPLIAVSLMAGLIPACRVPHADLAETLRHE